MTDEELREWRNHEARRRVEEEGVRVELLAPASAFSDTYAPEHPEVKGGRGPNSSTVRGLLAGGCCGWGRPPDAAELYDAMRPRRPTPRQLAVAGAFIGEAGIDDILMAYLEGAFYLAAARRDAPLARNGDQRAQPLPQSVDRRFGNAARRRPDGRRRRGAGMKLSKAAADTWKAHRAALHRIAGDEAEPSRLLLGGGTILNARWGHRESVDIDLLLPERRTLHDRLVVLVHEDRDPLTVLVVQRFEHGAEASGDGGVFRREAGPPLDGGELLGQARLHLVRPREVAAAEAQAHHGVANRPVPPAVDVEPGEQRLVALEQLLQRVRLLPNRRGRDRK